jgi:HAD superfamily hydrolase (TIGR01484 family)
VSRIGPLAPLRTAPLGRVQGVFTDVDGTLTSAGLLLATTLRALERLAAARIRVVLVTGRPSGYAETWVRTLPVAGAIAENGGLYLVRTARGRLRKVFARPAGVRLRERRRLAREVARAVRRVAGARLSSDSRFTEVDLAVDYNEDVKLGAAAADRLEALLHARGIHAVRSSVHVNAWVGGFDKASMVRRFLRREWGTRLRPSDQRFVYLGDSFNDAPLFDAFALSIGVANVRTVLDRLETPPRYVTRAEEGHGFEELARAILGARSRG